MRIAFFMPLGNAKGRAAEAARRAQEAESAEQQAFERELAALRDANAQARITMADVKFEFARRALGSKYSQNQPRVPAGSPDGGQWTSGGGVGDSLQVSVTDPRDSAGLVINDATPDGVR